MGKYIRNGIFIEEINNSIVQLPIQDVLINLIPGFSVVREDLGFVFKEGLKNDPFDRLRVILNG